MTILEKIIAYKKQEVLQAKETVSVKELENSALYERKNISLSSQLKRDDLVGIIAEIKRASPSTGPMQAEVDVEKLSSSYIQSGASALSILTDSHFFHGTTQDLITARNVVDSPILRKDFIIDEYQLIKAKSIGADCILLIASCLSPKENQRLAAFAKSLGLEVLLEVHTEEQIHSHVNESINIIGVNNRNLADFTTDIENSKRLYPLLPEHLVKISESGIYSGAQIKELKDCGYDGFLIGGHFMKTKEPALTCKELIDDYKSLVL